MLTCALMYLRTCVLALLCSLLAHLHSCNLGCTCALVYLRTWRFVYLRTCALAHLHKYLSTCVLTHLRKCLSTYAFAHLNTCTPNLLLLNIHIFVSQIEEHSVCPVNSLTWLTVSLMLYHYLRRSPKIKQHWVDVSCLIELQVLF